MDKQNTRPGRNGGTLKNGGNNGGGRPRKLPALDQLMDKVLGEEKLVGGERMTAMEAVLRSLHLRAMKGDVQAAKVLLERGYGKPKQEIQLTGEIGGTAFMPEQIKVEVVNSKGDKT